MRAEQTFIQEAIGGEARQAILSQIKGRHRDERRHEAFERVEAAVVGNMGTDVAEPLIHLGLNADRGFLDHVARPARNRVVAFEPDVERTADITLGCRGKAREFLDLGDGHVASGRS